MSNTAAEPVVEEGQEQEVFTYELSDEEKNAVKASVIATHKGKAEDELTAEITAAEVARQEELKAEYAPIFAKAAELKALPENAEKTEDELVALAQEALATADPKGGDNYDINNDPEFMGRAAKGTDSTTAGTPAAIEAEYPDEIKAELEEWRKFKSDPIAVSLLKAKEANIDFDIVEMIAQSGLAYDPAKASLAEIKQWELNEAKKANPERFTDEWVSDQMELFHDMTPIRQQQEVKAVRDHLIDTYKKEKAKFAIHVAKLVDTSNQTFVQTVREAESELKTYEGQKYRGATVSKAQTDKVLNLIRSGNIPFKKADGTADVSRSVEALLDLELLPEMRQAAYERGKRDAKAKFDYIKTKPLLMKARSSAPSTRTVSREESLKKAQEKAGMI